MQPVTNTSKFTAKIKNKIRSELNYSIILLHCTVHPPMTHEVQNQPKTMPHYYKSSNCKQEAP
jgi:hypothetical protein